VNLIGEHTDYNGGVVLPAAVSLATDVALRYRDDAAVRGVSRERGAAEAPLAAEPDGGWLDYVRGVARVLAEEGRIPARGFDVAVASDLPAGAGLASSAALCVASAHALAAAAGAPFRDVECASLARSAQRAEAEFCGMPCGIMDQYVSACGRAGAALLLDCAELRAQPVALPPELGLLVFDTGVRRALRDSGYETRVRECGAARDGASAALGRTIAQLAQVEPEELDVLEAALAPELFRRARHVVLENARVVRCAAALSKGDLAAAGALLYASHASLAGDYEVSWPEADLLVAASRELPQVLGARMTGAGFGGCTLHLVHSDDAEPAADALRAFFQRETGAEGTVYAVRPGPGAVLLVGPERR
jgi:galactokinase